jgi:hypothetical protein
MTTFQLLQCVRTVPCELPEMKTDSEMICSMLHCLAITVHLALSLVLLRSSCQSRITFFNPAKDCKTQANARAKKASKQEGRSMRRRQRVQVHDHSQ